MKIKILLLFFTSTIIFSCRNENILNENINDQNFVFSKNNISTKKLTKIKINSVYRLSENISKINKFLKSNDGSPSGKMIMNGLELYEEVFEEVVYGSSKYYSFYVIGGENEEFEQKVIFKYDSNGQVQTYLLKYKRNNNISINPSSFMLEKLEDKPISPSGKMSVDIRSFTMNCSTYTITHFDCNEGGHHNGEVCPTSGEFIPYDIVSIVFDPACLSAGGSNGDTSGGTGGNNGGGSGPITGGGSGSDTEGGSVISTTPPVITIPTTAPIYDIKGIKTGTIKNPEDVNPLALSPDEIIQINSNDNLRLRIYQYLAMKSAYPFDKTQGPYDIDYELQNFVKFTLKFFALNPSYNLTQYTDLFMNENTNPFFWSELLNEDISTLFDIVVVSPNFKMSKIDQVKYPRFTKMVKEMEGFVKNNPIVFEALKRNTGLAENKIWEGLKWGQGPNILIKDIASEYGEYVDGSPNLKINAKYVRGLEIASLPTTQKNTSFLLAITILHEYTHYGDYFADGYSEDYEMGWGFEQDILGKARLTVEKHNAGFYVKMFKF